MLRAPRGLCALLIIALFAAPLLSGCGGSEEPTAAAAVAQSGVFGGIADQLKREDDEAELREIRENAPQTRQEREEAHEQAERAEMQRAGAAEPEGG